MEFVALGLSKTLCATLASIRITTPTSVQTNCIPPILSGADVVGIAATGSGKTAAFVLPLLQKLSSDPYGVFALILTPTRELALQIREQVHVLGVHLRVKSVLAVGGIDVVKQREELHGRPHFVIGTPGRVLALLEQPDDRRCMRRLAALVLDEADQLLTSQFSDSIKKLLQRIPPRTNRQTLCFSATQTVSLRKLFEKKDDDVRPKHAFVDAAARANPLRTVKELDQRYLFVPERVKNVYLHYLLRCFLDGEDPTDGVAKQEHDRWIKAKRIKAKQARRRHRHKQKRRGQEEDADTVDDAAASEDSDDDDDDDSSSSSSSSSPSLSAVDACFAGRSVQSVPKSCMVFVRTVRRAELISTLLNEVGVPCGGLHSLKTQEERMAVLQQFRRRSVRVLIATDVASRGLDIPSVDLVINADLPGMARDYVHRVGRTARAGRRGLAINLVTQYDVKLCQSIERQLNRHFLELRGVNEESVLVHLEQTMVAERLANLHLETGGFDDRLERKKASKVEKRNERAARRHEQQQGQGSATRSAHRPAAFLPSSTPPTNPTTPPPGRHATRTSSNTTEFAVFKRRKTGRSSAKH